jgi:hypothetical protein
MTINLQDLKSTFSLDSKPLQAGAKLAIAGVAAVVAGISIAVKATFDWAKDLDSLGDVADGTGDGLAAMAFIARKSGVGVDAVGKATFNLNKGLLKFDGTLDTVGKSLKNYGIDVKDVNGNVKDSVQLTDDIAKKYAELGTQQERVNFLTDIYGKAGKDMVDFFDTLVADGGIDAVTEKVKALGLAIDPARYEQFNRNLEEMKLVGLGLAVGFTEQLMPAFEAVSKWIMTKGIPAFMDFKKKIGKAFDKGGVLGVADTLLDMFDDIDWAQISKTLIDGINSINWSQMGMDFAALVSHISSSIGEFFREVDWVGLGNSLASALNNFVGGLFGTDEAGLQVMVKAKLAEITQAFHDWVASINPAIDKFNDDVNTGINDAMKRMWTSITTWLSGIWTSFVNWLASIGTSIATWATNTWNTFTTWTSDVWNTIKTWGSNIISSISKTIATLSTTLEDKLREIGKTFYNRASAWVQQAIQGFTGQIGSLISAVSSLVASINAELKKIITSFKLSISVGTSSSVQPGSGLGTANTGSTNPQRPGRDELVDITSNRANTSSTSNEITLSRKSIDALIDGLGRVIPAETVKAMAHV